MRVLVMLVLLMLASACASPRGAPPSPVGLVEGDGRPLPDALCPGPAAPPPQVQMGGPSTPPPPVPPPPPEATAYLDSPEPALAGSGDARVDAFLKKLLWEGGPAWRPYLLRAFAPIRANRAVLEEADREARPADPAGYVRRFVTPERIAEGRRLYAQMQGPGAPSEAPLQLRLALWGMLSDYGARPPRFDMIEALANLGACGRGPGWGEFSIYHAVRILAEGRIDRARARAYGDGRIGQLHFFPEDYLRWGVDGDGDGRVDIWTDRADILANLRIPAWDAGQPLVVEVVRPDWSPADPAQARMLRGLRSGQGMPATMFVRPGGLPWPEGARGWYGRYVEPYGPAGPAFLLSRNFTPVNMLDPWRGRWQALEEEPGFGLAAALLADAIAGRPGPAFPTR